MPEINMHKSPNSRGDVFAHEFKKLIWEFPEVLKALYENNTLTVDVKEEENIVAENSTSKYFKLTPSNFHRTNWRELIDQKKFVIFAELQTHLEPLYFTVKAPSKKKRSYFFTSPEGKAKFYLSNSQEETLEQALDSGTNIYIFDSNLDVINFLCEDDLKRSSSISSTSIFAFRNNSYVYTLVYVDGGWGFQNTLLSTKEQPVMYFRNIPFLADYIKEMKQEGIEILEFKNHQEFTSWVNTPAEVQNQASPTQEEIKLKTKQKIMNASLISHTDFIDQTNASMSFMVRREFLKREPSKHFIIEEPVDGILSHYELVKYDQSPSGAGYWGFKNVVKTGLDEDIKYCDNLWKNSVSDAVDNGETVYLLSPKEYGDWLGLSYPAEPTEMSEHNSKSHPFNETSPFQGQEPFIGFKFNGVPFRLIKVVGTYGFLCNSNPESSLLFKENLLTLEEYIEKLHRKDIVLTQCVSEEHFQNWLGEDGVSYNNSYVLDENSVLPGEGDFLLDKFQVVLILGEDNLPYYLYYYNSTTTYFRFISSSMTKPDLFPNKSFSNFNKIIRYAIEQGHKVLHFTKGSHKIWLELLNSKIPAMSLYPESNTLEGQLVEATTAVEDSENNVYVRVPFDSSKICAYERDGEVFKLVQEKDELFPNYKNNYAFVSLKNCFLPSTLTYLTSPEECIDEVTQSGHRVYEFETEENFRLWASQVINLSLEKKLQFLRPK